METDMSGSNSFEVEVQALKSIYDNDFQLEGDAVIIRVHPLQNEQNEDENDAQIDLHVVCPQNYPDKLPEITFRNCKGLSNSQITILTAELESLKLSLRGKPMIYDLVCHVLNYLLDNNKPRRKSCYDEMICRKKQEEAKFKSDEDRRLRKIYDVQKKVRRKMEDSNSSEEDDLDNKFHNPVNDQKVQIDRSNSGERKNKIQCPQSSCFSSKYIHFKSKVLRGSCLDHHEFSTIYSALDTTTGEQLTVHEWVLKSSQKLDEIGKILRSIENEMNYLKVLSHENLNTYIDFKWVTERDEIVVYIAEKYISDTTLKTFIRQHEIIHLNFVQSIVESILRAILYLHDRKVVIKNLSEENIFVSKSNKLKVASYSIPKRMDDLYRLCHDGVTSTAKADQKTDIKHLGLILNNFLELIPNPNYQSAISDQKLLEFKDFIEKCLIKNEERRWGARELLDHKFLRNTSSYEPSRRRTLSYPTAAFETNDEVQEPFDFPVEEQNSRLLKDFYILEDIGKGSFGKVLKVRNKLDRQIYAIKEIKLDKNIKQLDKKIIREVNLLSKLKHENVVRYYTSWIETYSETESLVTGNMDKSKDDGDDDDDDEEEEDDEEEDDSSDDGFWQKNDEEENSSFVVFQADDAEDVGASVSVKEEKEKENKILPIRIMYIQMEFCEKSTLKYAIKNNLYEQEARCWRLLREIVEGLTYIHAQGLIHRDLKPDNIFLDSCDHVKIGDFGLAKIRKMSKPSLVVMDISLGGGDYDNSYYTQGGSNTAGVGTSYYVAPEMGTTFEKSHYNEKVDVYSLGIIFFEICHPPFNTGMERHDVLTKLRKPEIVIPPSLEEKKQRQMELVRKLLNHAPASRPSSKEILEDHVPPAEVEFEELKEIVRKTLMNPETKAYKYLISSWLNQKVNIDEDITYHLQNFHSEKFHFALEMAKEPIENIFKNHGGVFLSTPILLPQNEVYAKIGGRVKLITQSGAIVNLPYDLRVPFARYVTLKDIRRFRRYTIDRVHRQQKVDGVLPKELYECAFDIVSPKLGHLADEWEILSVMVEVVNSIPSLKNRHCVIFLNHALILGALLRYCNAEKFYSEIFRFLTNAKINKHEKRQLEANLLSLELGIQAVNTLVNFFDKEDTVYALKEELLALFSNREGVYEPAEKGFNKLSKIIEGTENCGINIPVKVRLGVVCNTEYCSDIMFDLVCKTKHKRGKESSDVIMSGCRYDGLLRHFRKLFSVMNVDVKEANQSAIGVSISLDKIAAILKEDNVLSEQVLVCSTDQLMRNKHKTSFIKELRESGIKCYFEDDIDGMEDLLEYCGENKITHVVNLMEENGQVLVMSWDSSKCRYKEKKISKREVAEYILKNSKSSEDQGMVTYQRSESKTSSTENGTANQSFDIHILSEEKSLTRRKHENQIRSKIAPILRHFSPRTKIEVVGVDLDEGEINRLAMSFKPDDGSYMSKILSTADRSSKKTYLSKICKKLESFFTPEKSSTVVIVYGLGHDQYQLILDLDQTIKQDLIGDGRHAMILDIWHVRMIVVCKSCKTSHVYS